MKILLTISYDGSSYCGWQRQNNGVSVQQRLEEALTRVLQSGYIPVTGASRTDARVHALGQRASFEIGSLIIPLERLCQVVNSYLPEDIVVCAAKEVADNFHPRFDAKSKVYKYSILNKKYNNPMLRNAAWHVPYELDILAMQKALDSFVGVHDFAAFCASGGSAKTTTRTIYSLELKQSESLDIIIRGNGFLYNMVRIIAGTLVYVGNGKISPSGIKDIIISCDRRLAGKTAPPQGLTLMEIEY